MKPALASMLLFLLLVGCTGVPTQQAPASGTTIAPTFPPQSAPSSTPNSLPLPVPTSGVSTGLGLATPFIPFYVTTNTENVLLRANPGVTFEPKTTLSLGLQLLVLSRVPGGEWIFVLTPFDSTGWVSAELLKSDKDLQSVPLMQPPDVQVIRGRVLNAQNEPVTGIMFGILEDVEGAKSFSVMTDASGYFYGYLPVTAGGSWSVTFDKAACSSNTMDANCNCIGACGASFPESAKVTLPQTDILMFQWR